MKKGIISIVLCIAIFISLIPTTVFAESVEGVTFYEQLLTDGMYYTLDKVQDKLIESTTLPEETAYLYYENNNLMVVGENSFNSPKASLIIKGKSLTISGYGILQINNDYNPAVIMDTADKIILKDGVNFFTKSLPPTINGGTIETSKDYFGNIEITGINVFANVENINLETKGNILIAGLEKNNYCINLKNIKLKGERVDVVNYLSGPIINATESIEIESNNYSIDLRGISDKPIISGKNIKLSADEIKVINEGSAAINGDLVAIAKSNTYISGNNGQAIIGSADITSNNNVSIYGKGTSPTLSNLKVRNASSVYIQSESYSPAIAGAVDVDIKGDFTINSKNAMAISSTEDVSIKTSDGFIRITSTGENPVISAYNKSVTLNARGSILVQGNGNTEDVIYASSKNITSINDTVILNNNKGGTITINGKTYNYGGNYELERYDLSTPPLVETYYITSDGYMIFQPKKDNECAKVILNNVDTQIPLDLPEEPCNLVLEGNNKLRNIIANNKLTISGEGSLDAFNISNDSLPTIEGLAKLNTMYEIQDTVYFYGNYRINNDYLIFHEGTQLILKSGTVLTINENSTFGTMGSINGNLIMEPGSSIINNGMLALPLGTTGEDIKKINISGIGVVRVPKENDITLYSNKGEILKVTSEDIDLTAGDYSDKTIEKDGYEWKEETKTLTLGNVAFMGEVTVPNGIVINTINESVIKVLNVDTNYYKLDLTFGKSGSLVINEINVGGTNGDSLTVKDGANVTITGGLFLGASGGEDGTLIVSGTGTVLNVNNTTGAAVYCDTVNIEKGATLNATSIGDYSRGIHAGKGGVNVTDNSTLKTSCDYGVYIINGKLNIDNSSKFITNANVAPFCIVDKTAGKLQSDIISLPALPTGTKIIFQKGVDTGSDINYWSLVDTNGNLDVSYENNEPVLLIGAMKGNLTFVKAEEPKPNPDNGGGTIDPINPSPNPDNGGTTVDPEDSNSKLNGISKDTVNGFKDSTPKTGDILPITLIVVLPFAWVALLYLGIRLRRK